MSGFTKTNKLLAGLIAAVLATGGAAQVVNANPLLSLFGQQEEPAEEVVLQQVEVRDIENAVNLTGALASASEVTSAVSPKASELPVREVKVKVGDTVKAGDVLFTLDTREQERVIKETEKKLAILERKNTINARQEQREKVNLEKDNAINSAKDQRALYKEQDHLNDKYYDEYVALNELYGKYAEEDASYNEAAEAQALMYEAEAALDTVEADPNASVEELNEMVDIYNDAVTRFNETYTDYEKSIDASIVSEKSVREQERTVRDAERDMQDKQDDFDIAERERQEKEKKAADTREIAALDRSVSDQEDIKTLETARETVSAATITATISGVVTAVNVQEGAAPSADPVVITNIANYNVACDVDEQYIADIQEGMKAHFTTNSTGEELLDGEVIFTAVTPTKQQSSNNSSKEGGSSTNTSGSTDKSRGTYRVLIKVNDSNERLRPGMTAKISIITAEAKGVMTVPNECISSDIDGNSVLTVTTDGGKTSSEVIVTTGLTDGTYTEVSGDGISEGTQLLVPETEDFAFDPFA